MKLFWKNKEPRRVRTPTVIQMEAVECGAAALSIVLSYYKKFIPLEELRTVCGVTRDGSKASQIVLGARALGLKAEGYKKEIEDLPQIKLPFIVFWNFNHFLVVEGFGKNKVYLNDPALGPRTVSMEEFDESFTGIVIELEPDEQFEKGGSPPSFIYALKSRIKGVKGAFAYTLLATLGLVVPGLGIPVLTQIFFDKILSSFVSYEIFFTGILVIIALSASLNWLQRYVLLNLNAKLSIQLSSKFFWHILRLPIQFFSQRFPGEIANRLQTNDIVIQALTGQLILAGVNLIFVFFYLMVMIQINWPIAALTAFFAIVNMIALLVVNRSRSDAFARLLQDYGKSIGVSVGALRNIDSIKSLGTESDFFSRWAGYFTKSSLAIQEINKKDILLTSLPPFLQMVTVAFFLSIGAKLVMMGDISIGMLMGLQVLILNFITPFSQFINLGQVAQQVKADLNRIDDVMNNNEDKTFQRVEKETIGEEEPTRLKGLLELKNITFGFDPQAEPFIQDLSFTLEPGKSIAFVGPSGCGKSTISKLITSLILPWDGTILFDEKDYNEIKRTLLVRSLATVDQSFFIFEGTFRENITLWDTTIDDEDLIRAAKDACIHEDIVSIPQGYFGKILEGGKNLSGGQKQRIEIARSLVRKPTIIILDEATASLDSTTEQTIMRNIKKRGMSSILIAHRLSTIRDCDEIFVLDKGKIKERGTHDDLKKQEGLYHELVKAQGIEYGN